jgi:hypothetical protein
VRIAIAIFALMVLAGCAHTVAPLSDAVYRQEVSDRFVGAEPPREMPRGLDLVPRREERGLIRGGRYYAGKRWLPDDKVTGLAPDGSGGLWARTETGYAHIYTKTMTLEEKARIFEERVRARHLRYGLVASSHLKLPGDLSSSETLTSDNDGLWTAMYVAAEAFRYAVTGSEEARRFARESYRAIERLQTISGIPGFPARSFVKKGESTGGDGEWHPTLDGEWLWKGDTSSDEIDGHFFVAGIYYDLVADEAEKETIRKNVRAIMDHLIGHGYYLVDLDGKPTTWGVWAPEKLNGDPKWWVEKGLNSMELLSYLASAEHITGDPKYRSAARELIENHHYAENTVDLRICKPPEEVNHSDDELIFLSYYNLLRYEKDPRLLATYRKSLERSYGAVAIEENPLWTFITLAGLGDEGRRLHSGRAVTRAAATLRETPLDMVEWRMENSERRDLVRSPHSNRFAQPVALLPIHPAERGGLKYNSDPYRLDDGGDGTSEDDGSFFLLAYWMGRHHGYLGPPEPPPRR